MVWGKTHIAGIYTHTITGRTYTTGRDVKDTNIMMIQIDRLYLRMIKYLELPRKGIYFIVLRLARLITTSCLLL